MSSARRHLEAVQSPSLLVLQNATGSCLEQPVLAVLVTTWAAGLLRSLPTCLVVL